MPTMLPVQVTTFEAVAGMTAQVFGGLTVSAELSVSLSYYCCVLLSHPASVKGHVDSGPITLLNVGIPGITVSNGSNRLLISPHFRRSKVWTSRRFLPSGPLSRFAMFDGAVARY
jgi:hypothetical protein